MNSRLLVITNSLTMKKGARSGIKIVFAELKISFPSFAVL